MIFSNYSDLMVYRSNFLELAIQDTKKWCVLPDQPAERQKPSDQYWIQLFAHASSQPVTSANAKQFLITFQLIRASWQLDDVASAINRFASTENFIPTQSITEFSTELRALNKFMRRQTSAASKIANFAYPSAQVYIWDALATKSARLRDKARKGASSHTLGLYTSGKEHDYNAFHGACALTHQEEKRQSDFAAAVVQLDAHFIAQGGPMANRDIIPLDFIERRLLDKLMFWEGWAVDRKALPEGF